MWFTVRQLEIRGLLLRLQFNILDFLLAKHVLQGFVWVYHDQGRPDVRENQVFLVSLQQVVQDFSLV